MVVAASTVSTGRSSISTVSKNHSLSSRQNDASPNPSRRPLIASERDNASVTKRLPAKEISSRYLSSYTSPSSITSTSQSSNTTTLSSSYSASSRRFPSPAPNHRPCTPPSFPQRTDNRRSYSVDRTRPTTPHSRWGGGDGAVPEMSNAGRALCTTTRSLSVSFQGESFFYQTSKAKTPSPVPTRKHPTPERRRASTPTRSSTPCTAEKSSDHRHHCWPTARNRQSNLLTKSLDCSSDKDPIFSTAQLLRQSMLFVDGSRRPSSDSADFSISSDTDSLSSGSNPGTPELRFPTRAPPSPRLFGMPARIRQETNGRLRSLPHHGTPLSSSSSKSSAPLKMPSARRSPAESPVLPPPRSASSPLRGSARPSCPSKVAGSPCRGTASPSRGRGNGMLSVSSSPDQPANASSITSFAAELRRSKKGESQIEEAHMLKVLYNKHLHWRHANARANAAILIQRTSAEKKMHNAWITSSKLYDLVTIEKIKLQLLTQQLKQAIILKGQMTYLEEWFNLEKDHSSSLSRAIEVLKACTLHLPVVNGARAELKDVKDAVGSAIDVMQAMGASICSLLSKVESTSLFASQLSEVVARERELMHQSRDLLSTVAALHVKQCSLRGQFLQLKRRSRFVRT